MMKNSSICRLVVFCAGGITMCMTTQPSPVAAAGKGGTKDLAIDKVAAVSNLKVRMDERLRTPETARAAAFAAAGAHPADAARAFLASTAEDYGMDPDLSDLELEQTRVTPGGTHVCFRQVVDNIPVYLSRVCVTVNNNDTISYMTNTYRPEVYDAPPELAAVSEAEAIEIAKTHLGIVDTRKVSPKAEPMYLVTQTEGARLAVKVSLFTPDPFGSWEIFVDAVTGEVLEAADQLFGATARGRIFNPDPLTTAQVVYGQGGQYIDNNDADAPELTAELQEVDLLDVTIDTNGYYQLAGPYCELTDINVSGDVFPSNTDGNFFYTRSQDEFESVMAYYYIDHMNRYAESLGYHEPTLDAFNIDPHGEGNARNAHFVPAVNGITVGDGGIDGGEDATLLVHEFGHALEWNLTPGNVVYIDGDMTQSVLEGTSDYWAASYATDISDFGWDMIGTWWYGPEGGVRTVDTDMIYPDDFIPGYPGAPIWSTALMDIWWSVGKTVADTLVLETHSRWGNVQNFTSAALALISAETDLYGGAYRADVMHAMNDRAIIKYIDSVPYTDQAVTVGRTREWPISISSGGDAEYMLHLPAAATITLTTCSPNTDFDTTIEIFNLDGSSTGLINDDDFTCGSNVYHSTLRDVSLAAGDYYVAVSGFAANEGTYELNVSAVDDLKVYVLDEGLWEGNFVKPRFYIENNGVTTVSDFDLEYYFFVSEGRTPILEDWWTPNSTPTLESMGGGLYRIVFDFSGVTLPPGGRIPDVDGSIVGLHFNDWSTWNKTDDFSNPGTSSYALNEKVAIFDNNGVLIYGSAPVPPGSGPVPTALEAYIMDETLWQQNRSQPRFYLVNNDTVPLNGFKVRYFLTADGGNTPVYDPYWIPGCSGTLENRGGGQYAVLFDCSGTDLVAGGRVPEADGYVFGLHNASWTGWYKWNDYSQPSPSGGNYALTNRIAVYDTSDNLIYGSEP